MNLFKEKVLWTKLKDRDYPYQTVYNETIYTIRLNDFPSDTLYSLLAHNRVIADFNDFPNNWKIQDTGDI